MSSGSQNAAAPLLSVIIPCGRPERASQCINGLLQQDIPVHYEIIVVIPASGVGQIHHGSLVRCVETEQLFPPGKMRNIGTAAARGSMLCFLDDDCIPTASFLGVLFGKLEQNREIGLIGCRVVASTNTFWARHADYALFAPFQYFREREIALGSAALMCSKSVFDQVGGFDEELYASEDWDLSIKVDQAGYKTMFTPETTVDHDHRRDSFQAIMKQAFSSGYQSGLVVQERHVQSLSWLAQLSVRWKSPLLYGLLIVPYSVLIVADQAREFLPYDRSVLLHIPGMMCARLCYHAGVFWYLVRKPNRVK